MTLTMGQTAGSPYVTLTKTGADGEFTVTRTVAGVQTPVRGTLTVVGGTGTLVDREAPQGVSVSYQAGADSTSGTTLSVGAWLIHPADDDLDVPLVVSEYPEWSRQVRRDALMPLRGRYPIVVSDSRQSKVGTVKVVVNGSAAQAALEAALESTRVFLLSTNHYQIGSAWVALGNEGWQGLNPAKASPHWMVSLDVTEVARPESLTSGAVTWLDVSLRYATFDDLAAEYGTFDAFWADAITWTS